MAGRCSLASRFAIVIRRLRYTVRRYTASRYSADPRRLRQCAAAYHSDLIDETACPAGGRWDCAHLEADGSRVRRGPSTAARRLLWNTASWPVEAQPEDG